MPAKKQITREMILDAAMALLRTEGIDAVQVRSLAKYLHCSTQPIYLSFSGMDALRTALNADAVALFLQALRDGSNGTPPRLYGMPYIRFAGAEKKLFQFLFLRPNAFSELRASLAPVMQDEIGRLMQRCSLDYDMAHHLHDQLWMHTHGIASMLATDFCVWDMDKVARMVADCEADLCRRYEHR